MINITAECIECSGTGLYTGLMEAKGEAVICVRCHGKGKRDLQFKEFTGRKKRRGISKIRAGSGMIIDTPNKDRWISYKEFEEKIPDR